MANNSKTTPKCLCCRKRLNPQFKIAMKKISDMFINEKVGIKFFGKTKDDMFCSDQCATAYAHLLVDNISVQENMANIRKLRLEQLKDCYQGCIERDFNQDAIRYAIRYNDYLYSAKIKGFEKIEITNKQQ